jgi:hypothetical protein
VISAKSSSVNDQLDEPTGIAIRSLIQGGFHVVENPLSAPAQRGMALPAHIVGENTDGIEPRLTPEISQRRESSDWAFTEQFASRPLDLGAPSQRS